MMINNRTRPTGNPPEECKKIGMIIEDRMRTDLIICIRVLRPIKGTGVMGHRTIGPIILGPIREVTNTEEVITLTTHQIEEVYN